MVLSFASPVHIPARHALPVSCAKRVSSRARFSMISISRPGQKTYPIDFDDPEPPASVSEPEVAAIAGMVCEFMNQEHIRDIANYVVRFGKKFDDLSQLSAVRLTALDAAGFTADVVSCENSQCVCVQERLEWPLGLCHNAADIISAFKHLSILCGLPADF